MMSYYNELMHRLRGGEQVLIDGGTGTEVERRGVPQLENAWNGGGTLSHPDIVRSIHEDYIRNGAEVVIANTFATSRNLLEDAGVVALFEEYNRRGVELACEAREKLNAPSVLVAGGISHWSFSGRFPSAEEYKEGARQQAAIMRQAGADLIMLEMMVNIERMLAVLDGANASGLPVWVGLSCAPSKSGLMCLQAGETDADGKVMAQEGELLVDALSALREKNVPLISIMHTDVDHIDDCLDIVEAEWDGFIGVYAHSGAYIDGAWQFDGTISPEAYTKHSARWLDRGIHVIGGCCGIRPEHIDCLNTHMHRL